MSCLVMETLLKLIKVNASKLQFKEKKVVEFRVSCDF